MAIKKPITITSFPFLLLLLLVSTVLLGVLLETAHGVEDSAGHQQQQNPGPSGSETKLRAQEYYSSEEDTGEPKEYWRATKNRRLMIGSTAPTCTYNECRGCRFKCQAEQIPVDANDPINSAYHYRCVCHR